MFQGDGAEASHDNLIVNNTVYNPTGSRAAIQVADGANNNVVFNNILVCAQSTGMEIQTVTGLVHDYNFVSSYTGGAATAHESNPAAATLFVSAATGDLRLVATAAAVDHGIATLAGGMAPATDVLGAVRPAGAAIDIGAYEDGAAGSGAAGGGGSAGRAGSTGSTGAGGSGGKGAGGATGTGGSKSAGRGGGGIGGAESGAGGRAGSGSAAGGSHGTSGANGAQGGAMLTDGNSHGAAAGGCSCRTTQAPDGYAPWFVALAVLLFRRSRRTARL